MARTIAYWLTTGLVALAYAFGGYIDLAQPPEVVVGAKHLGYPLYFFTLLGLWKLLAVVALLAPGLPRLKEWTYAGLVFNLTSASASHAANNDPVPNILTPLVFLVLAAVSWALRPEGRRLPGPIL